VAVCARPYARHGHKNFSYAMRYAIHRHHHPRAYTRQTARRPQPGKPDRPDLHQRQTRVSIPRHPGVPRRPSARAARLTEASPVRAAVGSIIPARDIRAIATSHGHLGSTPLAKRLRGATFKRSGRAGAKAAFYSTCTVFSFAVGSSVHPWPWPRVMAIPTLEHALLGLSPYRQQVAHAWGSRKQAMANLAFVCCITPKHKSTGRNRREAFSLCTVSDIRNNFAKNRCGFSVSPGTECAIERTLRHFAPKPFTACDFQSQQREVDSCATSSKKSR